MSLLIPADTTQVSMNASVNKLRHWVGALLLLLLADGAQAAQTQEAPQKIALQKEDLAIAAGAPHLAAQCAVAGKNVRLTEGMRYGQYAAKPEPSSLVGKEERYTMSNDELASIPPALEKYSQTALDDLWKRPGLSSRDRSLGTVAALIAGNRAAELPHQMERALDNGVTPAELSEVITHLAFYSGRGSAMTAVAAAKPVFAKRGVSAEQLAQASPTLLPLNEQAEAERAARVSEQFAAVAPGVVQYTTDVLFRDLWLRPGLAPRDRSLITVSALVASGQVAQIPYHLNRAMDNGLSQAQAGEVLTQLAFHAGWPTVFSALPIFKDVFEKRSK